MNALPVEKLVETENLRIDSPAARAYSAVAGYVQIAPSLLNTNHLSVPA